MAEGFVGGIGYAAFKDDDLRLYAVTRCLEISRRRRGHDQFVGRVLLTDCSL
jgi:hypothetical protein